MSETMKALKTNSIMRRQMMTEILGFSNVKQLLLALNPYRKKKKKKKKKKQKSKHSTKKVANVGPRSPEHFYENSSTFLKGTKSFNPHNDYCQHYIDTGQRPQNFIRDNYLNERFEEHPKLKELIQLKDELVQQTATPPMFLKCDLNTYDFKDLNMQFDVILVEPPLEEYQQTIGYSAKLWNWNQIMNLELNELAANRSFIFLWCGSSDGLDKGRDCLRHWGFRRCEDICWVQTNIKNPKHSKTVESHSLFQRTKEHCLMGIKGTIRRSKDSNFIHTNIDTDLIINERNEYGSIEKPDEIFNIIEHFCLGKRRLHLFGRDSTIRPGWLTIGHELTNSNFNVDIYKGYFKNDQLTTGSTNRIEELRPKSPQFKNKMPKDINRKIRHL